MFDFESSKKYEILKSRINADVYGFVRSNIRRLKMRFDAFLTPVLNEGLQKNIRRYEGARPFQANIAACFSHQIGRQISFNSILFFSDFEV